MNEIHPVRGDAEGAKRLPGQDSRRGPEPDATTKQKQADGSEHIPMIHLRGLGLPHDLATLQRCRA